MNEYGLKDIESDEELALRGVEVAARITGLLVETSLTQKYKNDTETNLELAYTFPLPVGATLLSFTVKIGERSYQGEVIPRADAEVEYEKAITEGNSAFRLQEIRAGLYNATLGNVMAGEAVDISIGYVETLAWNGNSLRYRLPTTIAPRYGEPTGMQPWQRPETSMMAEYALKLTVTIAGELARCAINCPSHKVSFLLESNELKVTLAKGATMDRDFILEMESANVKSLGIQAFSRDMHVAMLTLLPPQVEHDGQNRDVILILDCSGSMQGDSIRLAKEGILLALGSMQPNERFGLVAFGSNAITFDQELQPANRKNLDMARRWVNFLEGMGGTNLFGAMDCALKLVENKTTDILLLTDGEVWLDDDTKNAALKKGIRIFTMGIGSAVAQDVVQQLADDTGGACELVSPTEDMSARIYRHFNRMRQPQMEALDIRWPHQPKWVSQPERACFAGDAYTVFAAFEEAPHGDATATFNFSGQPTVALDVPLAIETTVADAVVRLGAKQHLGGIPQVHRQEWAVRFQLIMEETDYLIKVERAEGEKAEDFPELQIQPQMLPAGWGGTSSVHVCANVANVDSGIRFSRSASSVAYSHINDIPAVVRKSPIRITAKADNGYKGFIKRVTTEAKKKIFGGLPTTWLTLHTLALPDPLEKLLKELAAANYSEDDIVRAFYRAFIEHDGSVDISEKYLKKMHTIVGSRPLVEELVSRILQVLNRLCAEQQQSFPDDRYDIPAFLRKQAD